MDTNYFYILKYYKRKFWHTYVIVFFSDLPFMLNKFLIEI